MGFGLSRQEVASPLSKWVRTLVRSGSHGRKQGRSGMVAHRQTLPETRSSITHKFCIGGHEGYLTVGLHSDGRPGEIFIKMAKEGSTMSGMCQAFCRAFSLALQFGLSLEEAVIRFRNMRFEPMGATNNPDIPECQSIVDYVARFLELNFSHVGADRRI
jgi:ribonucleoside-diphosphate reductase alpha chain